MTQKHPWDKYVDMLTSSIMQSIERTPKSDIPFGSVPLSKEEQIQDYIIMRNDPQQWAKVFDENGLRDGMRYAVRMEKAIREPGEEKHAASTDNEG